MGLQLTFDDVGGVEDRAVGAAVHAETAADTALRVTRALSPDRELGPPHAKPLLQELCRVPRDRAEDVLSLRAELVVAVSDERLAVESIHGIDLTGNGEEALQPVRVLVEFTCADRPVVDVLLRRSTDVGTPGVGEPTESQRADEARPAREVELGATLLAIGEGAAERQFVRQEVHLRARGAPLRMHGGAETLGVDLLFPPRPLGHARLEPAPEVEHRHLGPGRQQLMGGGHAARPRSDHADSFHVERTCVPARPGGGQSGAGLRRGRTCARASPDGCRAPARAQDATACRRCRPGRAGDR